MKVFLDTSALVKFFHAEDGTDKVTELINSPDNEIWVSELARIEFMSALFKKYRAGVLDGTQLDTALAGFEAEYARFNIEPLGYVVATEAEKLLLKYGKLQGLRTLDALHLASFTLLAESEWVFVTSDDVLCRTVVLAGYSALNPCGKN